MWLCKYDLQKECDGKYKDCTDCMLDKIKSYIDHIRNTGMGKKKSLEFVEKYIDGLKAESEGV